MFRRLLIVPVVAAALVAGSIPAFAKARVIAQVTSPKNHPGVYMSRGLLPGKHYRIQIVVPGTGVSYKGLASESFTYILNKHLGTYSTTVKIHGKGTKSFALTMPKPLRKARVSAWMLVAEASSPAKHTTLKLRLVQS